MKHLATYLLVLLTLVGCSSEPEQPQAEQSVAMLALPVAHRAQNIHPRHLVNGTDSLLARMLLPGLFDRTAEGVSQGLLLQSYSLPADSGALVLQLTDSVPAKVVADNLLQLAKVDSLGFGLAVLPQDSLCRECSGIFTPSEGYLVLRWPESGSAVTVINILASEGARIVRESLLSRPKIMPSQLGQKVAHFALTSENDTLGYLLEGLIRPENDSIPTQGLVRLQIAQSQALQKQLFLAGDLSVYQTTDPDDGLSIFTESQSNALGEFPFDVTYHTTDERYLLIFNWRNAVAADSTFRRALFHALPLQPWIDQTLGGLGQAITFGWEAKSTQEADSVVWAAAKQRFYFTPALTLLVPGGENALVDLATTLADHYSSKLDLRTEVDTARSTFRVGLEAALVKVPTHLHTAAAYREFLENQLEALENPYFGGKPALGQPNTGKPSFTKGQTAVYDSLLYYQFAGQPIASQERMFFRWKSSPPVQCTSDGSFVFP